MGRSRRAGSYEVTRSAGWRIPERPADRYKASTGAAGGWGARPLRGLGGLAVGGDDGGGDQGDVTGVEVAGDGAEVDGDGGVAEAGGDPQDGLLRGGAGEQPALQGAQGGVPADDGERLAGADAGPGGDGAAEGVAVQEVPVADDQPGGGGIGGDAVGGVQELAGQLGDADGSGVHGDVSGGKWAAARARPAAGPRGGRAVIRS